MKMFSVTLILGEVGSGAPQGFSFAHLWQNWHEGILALVIVLCLIAVMWYRVMLMRKAMRARMRFLSSVSRDIRTSLSTIMGYTDLLELDGDTPATREAALRAIRASGEALLKLAEDSWNDAKVEEELQAMSDGDGTESVIREVEGTVSAHSVKLPRKVLLVDDSSVNRAVCKALLNKLGVPIVAFAEDGLDALKQLDATVEMVFTDLWMPNMDGPGLLQAIRAQPCYANLPVYALTADVEAQNNEAFTGFTEMLIKPITVDKLRALFSV